MADRFTMEILDSSILEERGRLTLPQEVLRRLGLKAGDRVEFVVEGKRVILRSLSSGTHTLRG